MGKLGVVSCLVVGVVWASFSGCGSGDDDASPGAYGGSAGVPGGGGSAGAGKAGRSGSGSGLNAWPGNCWLGPQAACNPLTTEGCDQAGAACDLLGDGAGTTIGFECFDPPNVQGVDQPCDNQNGPFCQPTLHCSPSIGPDGMVNGPDVCKKLCCDESSCSVGESCLAIEQRLGALGLCLPDGSGGSSGSGGGAVELPAGCWLGPPAECNPITREGCEGAGASCDLASDGQDTLLGLLCFPPPPPNDQVLGASCENDLDGPFCEPTLHCTPPTLGSGGASSRPLTCQTFCCASSDCGATETCLAFDTLLGSLGTCQPGAGGNGGSAGVGGAGAGGAGAGGAGAGGAGAGGAGANGSAGLGGSAGANGSAGLGGSAGANGSAGASGSAGEGGASGTSGNAGTSGSAGTSGNAGASGAGASGANVGARAVHSARKTGR